MNHSRPGDEHNARLVAPVCPQDREDSPFGWSSLPCSGVYGDPATWREVPPALTAEIVAVLADAGWTDAHATEHAVVVPLDERAEGLPGPAARGEHLYVVWGGARPEWSWSTAHPNAPAGGRAGVLLAPPDDPHQITAQVLRLLRTGRTLP
ncbi:hypothetical protein [Streptomyces sp. DH12]|uniref:hypothetical protein n=1 Tax=Streptomyces sp. DH12 TaxID=2857010 RepID=UPI001E5EF9B0|nr:hypothetical protein [Streptomyces sp. DH12]